MNKILSADQVCNFSASPLDKLTIMLRIGRRSDMHFYSLGSDGRVCMWDLDKILSAKLPAEEVAAERPMFRIDPMNEGRNLCSQSSDVPAYSDTVLSHLVTVTLSRAPNWSILW